MEALKSVILNDPSDKKNELHIDIFPTHLEIMVYLGENFQERVDYNRVAASEQNLLFMAKGGMLERFKNNPNFHYLKSISEAQQLQEKYNIPHFNFYNQKNLIDIKYATVILEIENFEKSLENELKILKEGYLDYLDPERNERQISSEVIKKLGLS